MERRLFLKSAAALGVPIVAGSGNFLARLAAASDRKVRVVFEATREDEIVNILFSGMEAEPSEHVRLAAPYITTPHQAAAVRVSYNSEPAQAIAITTTNAKHPLVALAMFHVAAGGFGTRIRLDRTSPVNAYVLTARGLFTSSRVVKVTRGGYGTNAD